MMSWGEEDTVILVICVGGVLCAAVSVNGYISVWMAYTELDRDWKV